VRHAAGNWLSEGVLRVKSVPPKEHHNRYEIVPFSPGSNATHWSAENAALGALNGRFVIAGDAILSFYASGTGRNRGFASMQQKEVRHILVRGARLDHDKVISTWALDLQLAR
jgi:hypothetical protein